MCVLSTFSNISETTWPIEAKYHMEPPWDGGQKVCANGPGRIAKTAAMPMYGKTLNNHLLQNQKAGDFETWYVSSGDRVLLPSLFK